MHVEWMSVSNIANQNKWIFYFFFDSGFETNKKIEYEQRTLIERVALKSKLPFAFSVFDNNDEKFLIIAVDVEFDVCHASVIIQILFSRFKNVLSIQ